MTLTKSNKIPELSKVTIVERILTLLYSTYCNTETIQVKEPALAKYSLHGPQMLHRPDLHHSSTCTEGNTFILPKIKCVFNAKILHYPYFSTCAEIQESAIAAQTLH